MRALALAIVLVHSLAGVARAQEDDELAVDGGDTRIPEAPSASRDFEDAAPRSDGLTPADGVDALADPFGLTLRATELEIILASDASGAEESRTLGAVLGYVIGAIGIGATPVFFALDDGTGLLPILSILPLQLGALSLATAILGSVTLSTEERRYASWRRVREQGRPSLEHIARYEGFLVADADRARDARLFTLAQGIAGIVTGIFTGVVGLALSSVELTQITLGTLGGIELLLGALQLLGALDAGDIESRPARYESRTGVSLAVRGSRVEGSF